MGLDQPLRVLLLAPPRPTVPRRVRWRGRGRRGRDAGRRRDDAVREVSALLAYRLGAFR